MIDLTACGGSGSPPLRETLFTWSISPKLAKILPAARDPAWQAAPGPPTSARVGPKSAMASAVPARLPIGASADDGAAANFAGMLPPGHLHRHPGQSAWSHHSREPAKSGPVRDQLTAEP